MKGLDDTGGQDGIHHSSSIHHPDYCCHLHFVRQRRPQQHLSVKIIMATPLKPIECSAQPLCISFHPCKDIVAAGLVDGTVDVHDLHVKKHSGNGADDHAMSSGNEDEIDDEEEEDDTILSTIFVAKQTTATFSSASATTAASPSKKATQ